MTSDSSVIDARRIVVKVGTSTLTRRDGGIDLGYIADLTAQLASLRNEGREIVLVTSGAIRAGLDRLVRSESGSGTGNDVSGAGSASNPLSLPHKQAAAAVGQGILMRNYTEAFGWRNVTVAQVLLTRDDLSDRRRFLNARNTLRALLGLGVVPIVNENDTVAVEEIRFGDNDQLAAQVAVLIEADLLVILSDVDGLYDSTESEPDERRVLKTVTRIDQRIEALAGGSVGGVGTGGMRTKIEAARIATASGIRVVIANGRSDRVVARSVSGEDSGTTFVPAKGRVRGRKRWIAAGSRPRGAVTVNGRAAEKICREGVSLLAVGISEVCGEFDSGDLIDVRDDLGRQFARGLSNYGSDDIRLIMGLRSSQIESRLGGKTYDEVIHRDNLFVDTTHA